MRERVHSLKMGQIFSLQAGQLQISILLNVVNQHATDNLFSMTASFTAD